MKKALLVLVALVACSGQKCVTTPIDSGLNTSGQMNVCDRSYFESTYRIGIDLPTDIGTPQSSDTNTSVARQLSWDWSATSPATKFILVISTAVSDTGIEQVAVDSAASFAENNFTVMESFNVTLDDGAEGWYFALSPNDKADTNVELVMTLSQERLVTLSATYASTITTEQSDAIGAALRSLCADVE